jgi:SAM-dependent methyltransferase
MNTRLTHVPATEREPRPAHSSPRNGTTANFREDIEENLWAYAKRLRFVREVLVNEFAARSAASVRVLDVGCGNGSLLAIPLARRGYDVTGTDLHAPSIEHARRLAREIPNARFEQEAVTELSAPAFDVVILSEVLEHVDDPKALLLASMKHLKNDGIVVVTVPNGYGEFEIDWWIFRNLRFQRAIDLLYRFRGNRASDGDRQDLPATDNHGCGHVQFFRLTRLRNVFRDCSLCVAKESAGSFICGPIVCYTLARSRRFIEWNARIADRLPLAMASSWYFALRRATM